MKFKVNAPIEVVKTETIPEVSKWDIRMEIVRSNKTIRFHVRYITLDQENREKIVGSRLYQISDSESNQFWNISDPALNLGQLLKKRVLQTFKAKNWVPSDTEEDV